MREMKDSGIEWIGKIPQSWGIRRIKHIASLAGRIGWQGLTSDEYSDEGAYLITGVDFSKGRINWEKCVHVPLSRWEEASQIQIREGDLLITKDGTVGKVAIAEDVPGETSLNSGVLLIRNNDDCDTKFLFWMIQSEVFWKWFGIINAGNSTIIHLYQHSFANFSFPYPKKEHQCRITGYLDAKCSKIDEIIAKQEQIIEKLKKYKLSIITEVVTKGINSDAVLKNSSIDWLGETPCKWEVKRIKNICDYIESGVSVNAGINPAEDGEYGVLKTSCVSKFEFDVNENKSVNRDEMTRVACPVCKNTIIVSRMNTPELVGACGYVAESRDDVFLPDRLWQVHFKENVFVKYIWYYLRSENIRYYYSSLSMGTSSSMQNISQGDFLNAYIPLPPYEEQVAIAAFLDSLLLKNKTEIAKRKQIIEKLQEYKKALIYEIVTGKKEV